MKTTISLQPQPTAPSSASQPAVRILWTPAQKLSEIEKPYPLPPGATYLGREPGASSEVAFSTDPCSSRRHACIQLDSAGGSVQISDCGSRNGTLVEGERITGPRRLKSGDLIRIGDSFLLFRDEPLGVTARPGPVLTELIGISPAAQRLRQQVSRLAADRASVLILGPTGTGKEVVASALHRLSGRLGARIAVNCSAIPKDLAESQFFGHAQGAFTGAVAHRGYFQAAHLGTLFLDEIGDMPQELQPKLLRALEERAVMPVGTHEVRPVDVRLVSATNRDLEQLIAEGRFREDLYARLSDVVLQLPPLRARREDILLLLHHGSEGRQLELTSEVVDLLLRYPWPRNVREVYKVATHLRLLGADEALRSRLRADIAIASPLAPADFSAPRTDKSEDRPKLTVPTREQLESLMAAHAGVIQLVADALGCSRRQVGRWLEQYGVDRQRFRQVPETGA